jgi:energy-coupling factor transporter ATP-binding protein EcfA2
MPDKAKSYIQFIESIVNARSDLAQTIEQSEISYLMEQWPNWRKGFDDLIEKIQGDQEVVITLVGGTGSGKSTLLNAILNTNVLPVSQMQSCTAAVCKVGYSDQKGYSAIVEFISEEEWKTFRDGIIHEFEHDLHPDESLDQYTLKDISRSIRKRLTTVLNIDVDEDITLINLLLRKEPHDIREALQKGSIKIQSNDLKTFRQQISTYLASKGNYWPIVKSVSIRGPFHTLRGGVTLVDLPGINDPNEALEEVTKNYLKSSRYVWVVFNMKRLLTKDTIHLLLSNDFFRQIVMDGKTDNLAFIGTHSDDIDYETGLEEFDLDDDVEEIEVVYERNKRVKHEIPNQLKEYCNGLASRAHESAQQGEKLAQRLGQSMVFTVSAREYLRLNNITKGRPVILENPEESEIPTLQLQIEEIGRRYGIQASLNAHQSLIHLHRDNVKQFLELHKSRLTSEDQTWEDLRCQVENQSKALYFNITYELEPLRQQFQQQLNDSREVLRKRFGHANDNLNRVFTEIIHEWGKLNWQTLKAIVSKDGRHTGRLGTHDFVMDLARPMLDTIVFAWSEFYDEHLTQLLYDQKNKLETIVHEFVKQMENLFVHVQSIQEQLKEELQIHLQEMDRIQAGILEQALNVIREKINEQRLSLSETIPDKVRDHMKPAFYKASILFGLNVKSRMITILELQAKEVSDLVYAKIEESIYEEVNTLISWLIAQFTDMQKEVNNLAWRLKDNFSRSLTTISAEELRKETSTIHQLLHTLDKLG